MSCAAPCRSLGKSGFDPVWQSIVGLDGGADFLGGDDAVRQMLGRSAPRSSASRRASRKRVAQSLEKARRAEPRESASRRASRKRVAQSLEKARRANPAGL